MWGTLQGQGPMIRFAGLELSGAHSQKTCLAVLDFYPESPRLILSQIHPGMGREDNGNSDEILLLQLNSLGVSNQENFEFKGICTQAPTTLPPHFNSPEKAARELSWMNDYWHKTKPQPRKFLPYLNRPFEIWMKYFTPEKFRIPESMGANLAPLAIRLDFLRRDLKWSLYESYPRACVQRILSAMGAPLSWAENYTDIDKGIGIREKFVSMISEKIPSLFLYDYDLEILVFEVQAFHSFILAITQYLDHHKQCETRPPNFPQESLWGLIPKQHISWDKVP